MNFFLESPTLVSRLNCGLGQLKIKHRGSYSLGNDSWGLIYDNSKSVICGLWIGFIFFGILTDGAC